MTGEEGKTPRQTKVNLWKDWILYVFNQKDRELLRRTIFFNQLRCHKIVAVMSHKFDLDLIECDTVMIVSACFNWIILKYVFYVSLQPNGVCMPLIVQTKNYARSNN